MATMLIPMTRIISGRFRGLTLQVPKKGTRPTSDRVRESLFQILSGEDAFFDANVLDLYAGSGSLGFEALSRGATELTLVDVSSGSAMVLAENRKALLLRSPDTSVSVVKKRASAFLSGVHAADNQSPAWDLVFIDPPYDVPKREVFGVLEQLHPFLTEDAIVVLEQSSRLPFDIPEKFLHKFLERSYGDSTISLLTKVSALPSEA